MMKNLLPIVSIAADLAPRVAKGLGRAMLGVLIGMAASMNIVSIGLAQSTSAPEPQIYRYFDVVERDGQVQSLRVVPNDRLPRWAQDVQQADFRWVEAKAPVFEQPVPFVIPPEDSDEPFGTHHHQPAITWLRNGDLMAIWYSTNSESGTELTVLASRWRANRGAWDPASEFFRAPQRNMHGSSIFHGGDGTIYHFNGMGPLGTRGWAKLALLMRTSRDNGVHWTPPVAIGPKFQARHQVIAGTWMSKDGILVQCCDADPGPNGGTALHLSRDGGLTWTDPGAGQLKPSFEAGGSGIGTIAGIHGAVVELANGDWMGLGRGDTIEGKMPLSLSSDQGQSWRYEPSPFPPIGGGQRLILRRLREGPLLFVSFTSGDRSRPEANAMELTGLSGETISGHGLYAAVSFDEGATWPVRRLLTPGDGDWDGGAHTKTFTATPTRGEHAGYLAATQSPDGLIHLISSRLHYRFNLAWLKQGSDR